MSSLFDSLSPVPVRERAVGAGFVLLGVYLNIPYAVLGATFEYPAILRRPAGEVLERFAAGGPALVWTWEAFALAAVALVPLAVAGWRVTSGERAGRDWANLAAVAGMAAGVFQALGLVRWVFAVPYLAQAYTAPESTAAAREAAVLVFEGLHRFAGVAVGEHLGQLATAAWAGALSVAWWRSGRLGRGAAALGLGAAGAILAGLAEGFATVLDFDPGVLGLGTMVGYLALSVWMVWAGAALWRGGRRARVDVSPLGRPARGRPAGSVPSSV
jgi:hypothetical protein